MFGTIKFSRYYCSELLLPLEDVTVSVVEIIICDCDEKICRKFLHFMLITGSFTWILFFAV